MKSIIEKLIQMEQLAKEIREELMHIKTIPVNGALNEAPSMDFKEGGTSEENNLQKLSDKALRSYEKMIGIVTPAVMEGIDFAIGEGREPELVIRIIEYACEQGKRSWQYINAVLLGNLKENILTLEAYNRHQTERAEQNAARKKVPERNLKPSKLNNYCETNEKDYSEIQSEILNRLMEE